MRPTMLLTVLTVLTVTVAGGCRDGSLGDPAATGDPTLAGDPAGAGADGAPRGDGGGDAAGDHANPPGDSTPTAQHSCAVVAAEIYANTGNTIEVSPGAAGSVMVGGNSTTLRQVILDAAAGDTILLADGTYTFAEASGGSYTGLYFTAPDVTLRSASRNAEAVVLDSNYADHGESSGVISIDAMGIVLADFTVRRSIFHLVHVWSGGDGTLVHNLRLIDGGQQFIKASGADPIDDVTVSCTEFLMTPAGRDNVWGYGATDGGTRCYTGGIDTHNARSWRVVDSRFEGIYCNAGGVARPVHGKEGSLRGDLTYTGGLAEHAIHMWDAVQGYGHVLARNHIINCARGIGLGLVEEVYDSVIQNNMVFSEHAASAEHDVGIAVERAHDTQVLNNTVFFASTSAYPNAIEYRYGSTANIEVRNNLTNRTIRARDGAVATTSNNVEAAQASWFVDPNGGDLHLDACDILAVDGAGMVLGGVQLDLDQQIRGADNDIGADQCTP